MTMSKARVKRRKTVSSAKGISGGAGWVDVQRNERYIALDANGDCFYQALVLAVNSQNDRKNQETDLTVEQQKSTGTTPAGSNHVASEVSVSSIRSLVADRLTQAHFDALLVAFQVNSREYAFMRRCRTLESLQARQRLCGSAVGSRMCVWADWTQMQLAADALGVTILVRDAAGGFSLTLSPVALIEMPPALHCDPRPCETSQWPIHGDGERFVHVLRVDSCHYNVFAIGDQSLLTREQLELSGVAKDFF